MLLFEIKKIIKKKYVWIMLIIGTVLTCAITLGNLYAGSESKFVLDSPQEWYSVQLDKGIELENQKFDQVFLDNMRREINEYIQKNSSSFSEKVNDNPYIYAAEKLGYIDAFNLINNITGDVEWTMSISEKDYYDLVWSNMQTHYEDSQAEYWKEKYNQVVKPYTYSYMKGFQNFSELMYFYMWFVFLLVAVSLAGVFADDSQYKTDSIVYCTKKSKSPLIISKIGAGIIVAICEVVIVLSVNLFVSLIAFGSTGVSASIQCLIYCAYNMNIGSFIAYCFICAIVMAVLYASISMMISCLTKSNIAVVAIQTGVLIISLFNLPKVFGFISYLWKLRPTSFLMYSTFSTNTTVYNLFGIQLNALEASIFLYLIIVLLSIFVVYIVQQKNEVKSR